MFQDVGISKGKYYALNFPLRDGITDENYKSVFEPVSICLQDPFVSFVDIVYR